MRGTRSPVEPLPARRRFIPAYAGNASRPPASPPETPVHPRVCGERDIETQDHKDVSGSSPRMRGTLSAGAISRPPPAVHPRVCGERPPPPPATTGSNGSSPRMRGTPVPAERVDDVLRFIPAYAGNARRCRVRVRRLAVHPRVCGERGGGVGRPLLERRFIPAYAGNAAVTVVDTVDEPVHPRVCGERAKRSNRRPKDTGSSPRMRGTHRDAGRQREDVRFIPAYAGNARPRRCAR